MASLDLLDAENGHKIGGGNRNSTLRGSGETRKANTRQLGELLVLDGYPLQRMGGQVRCGPGRRVIRGEEYIGPIHSQLDIDHGSWVRQVGPTGDCIAIFVGNIGLIQRQRLRTRLGRIKMRIPRKESQLVSDLVVRTDIHLPSVLGKWAVIHHIAGSRHACHWKHLSGVAHHSRIDSAGANNIQNAITAYPVAYKTFDRVHPGCGRVEDIPLVSEIP